MSTGMIYKITNTRTNESYIGMSTHRNDSRIQSHFYHLNKGDHKNQKLQQAYDRDSEYFTHEILEYYPKWLLDSAEEIWIHKFDSYKNGYNQTSGGRRPCFWGDPND